MASRCSFDHHGTGPRCCVELPDAVGGQLLEQTHHAGPHLFKCAGPSCPGIMWPASVMAHPYTCALPVADRVTPANSATGKTESDTAASHRGGESSGNSGGNS
jgi:hypothetical protein